MKYQFPRYIPENSTPVTRGDLPAVVYTYTSTTGSPAAIAYQGKSNKPVWHYRFINESQRQDRINSLFSSIEYYEKQKAERRASRKTFRHGYQVGDILYASWGYEQTNIDFFQITATTEKTVTFREVAQTRTENAYMSGTCMPVKDHFTGKEFTRPVRPDDRSKGYVKFAEFKGDHLLHLWEWDGKPKGYSSYY